MIRPPQARLTILPGPFTYATDFIDRSGAVPLVEQWLHDDGDHRAEATTSSAPNTGAYSARALLIGLYLLIVTRQPISWASLLQMYWFQLDRQQIAELRLSKTIDPDRQRWLTSFTKNMDTHWPKEALAIQQSEYARLTRSLDRAFNTIRWSPHERTGKKTNAELKKRMRSLTAEERDVMEQRKDRHDLLINTLISASVDRSLLTAHRGDIMFDEVVVQTAKANGNTGTKPQRRHTGNPDAGWFMKEEIASARWGHGATFIMATHRPGQKRIPIVVVGMSLGKPTGGNVDETLLAVDYAEKAGLLTPRAEKGRSRYAIADLGFTRKSHMNERLTAKGYYLVQDYQDGDNRRFELQRPATTAPREDNGDGLRIVDNGPTLFNGILICPGFNAATKAAFDPLPASATEAERLAHQHRETQLLAGRMHPNGRPEPARQSRRGRPTTTSLPIVAIGQRVQAQCPAASGQCRCPMVGESLALGPDVPEVIDPPKRSNLPYVCARSISPVLMDAKQFKQYGVHLFGSAEHKKLYGYARSLNEQWHSQFRADHTGGIDGAVFNTLGVERIGVIIALAVAETNQASQRAFRHKHQDRDSLVAA